MKPQDLRVIVVDDTAVSRGLITQSLDWMMVEGYRACADSAEALRELCARPAHLVISDWHMPGMDGLDLLAAIRKTKGVERTGFILVTGRADAELVARGRALGMNNLITKPFSREQMRHAIEAVVGRL